MNWDSNYELGIAEIDAQHQFLFERIRMIESAVAIGGGADFVRSVIADLEHYSAVHFAAEEALFARYHYPDSEAHRLEQSTETAVQMHFNSQGYRTNNIMRTLTTLTAIFLPLNLIAAIFGMNFDSLPLIHQSTGFWWALGSMGFIALALCLFFWRKNYLSRSEK